MDDFTGAYVDVRGVHPVLVCGLRTWTLEGADRNITIEAAIKLARELELKKQQ